MAGPAGRATNDPTNYFALGVQGAKDQDAGTFYFFKHLDGTGFDVAFDQSSEREGGGGREIAFRYKTLVKSDGQAVAYARPDVTGRVLTWALGADTTTILATTPELLVNHLIQSGVNATLPLLTADQNWADVTERTTNCIISDVKIDFQAGHPLKITGQFISGGSPHLATTVLTPAREAGPPVGLPGASAWFQISGGSGVATSIELTKGSIEIKNQIDEGVQTLGLNREDVPWLNADYNFDGTLKYVDQNIWKQAQYGGGTQVPINLPTASFKLYSPVPGGSKSVEIGMPMLEVTAIKVNRLDPDGKTMFLDVSCSSIKSATNSIFANVVTGATGAYTATAT